MPSTRSARDAQARKKLDGVTKRLDRIESYVDSHNRSIGEILKLRLRIEALEKVSKKPTVTMARAQEALHKIQALPCACDRMYKDAGSTIQLVQTVTTAGGHHWTGCHVAIAAQGLGE